LEIKKGWPMNTRFFASFCVISFLIISACSTFSATSFPATSDVSPELPPPTPTSQPTETATDAPKTTGPCDNILFPLEKGNRWYYQKVSGGSTSNINLLVDSVEGTNAVINFYGTANDLTSKTEAQCKDGAIINFPISQLGMLFYDSAHGDVKLDFISGTFFPSEDAFAQAQWDYAWKTNLTATGSFQVKDPSSDQVFFAVLQNSPVALAWHTAGPGEKAREGVSVPAGNFPHAVKILLDATINIKLQLASGDSTFGIPAKLLVNSTLWFEPHVGLVKEVINSLDAEYSGTKFPQDVDSTLILKKYLQQK
jgi:hypothetical protein